MSLPVYCPINQTLSLEARRLPETGSLSHCEKGSAPKQQSGFSLIEILVAFSIAAVSLGIILQIYAKGTTSAILGEEYSQAVTIAESRLEELGTVRDMETAEMSGTELDKYHWEIRIDDYIPDDRQEFVEKMRLKALTIEVSWQSRGKQRSITLHSMKPVYPT